VDDGCPRGRTVRIEELDKDKVEGWADGSRVGGRAAGATRTAAQYLGAVAMIADAEAMGGSPATMVDGDGEDRGSKVRV